MKKFNYNSIAVLHLLIILVSSCSTVKIKNQSDLEWKNKIEKKFELDTIKKKGVETVVIDSLGNGLYEGYSIRKINQGTRLYFIKYKQKVTKLRYCPLTRMHNFMFAERKLNPYLTEEQISEVLRMLAGRVTF